MAVARFDAPFFTQLRQGFGHFKHATRDRPHAIQFNLRHQHQSGRRGPWRGAAVSGIAAKELLQARIVKVPAQTAPQTGEGPQARERGHALKSQITHHAQKVGALASNVGLL